MIAVMAPAKSMLNHERAIRLAITSMPRFLSESDFVANELKLCSTTQLQKYMKNSNKATLPVAHRLEQFALSKDFVDDKEKYRPAAAFYRSPSLMSFKLKDMSDAEQAFAQDHIRILSGMYGYLRPCDLIQIYRVNMAMELSIASHSSIAGFWEKYVMRGLHDDFNTLNSNNSTSRPNILLNLASGESFASVKEAALVNTRVIHVQFLTSNEYVSHHSKIAKGLLARHIVQTAVANSITSPDVDIIQSFCAHGYSFKRGDSSDSLFVFTRSLEDKDNDELSEKEMVQFRIAERNRILEEKEEQLLARRKDEQHKARKRNRR